MKMWSKSDSGKKKKREIDKVLSGSLGTQKALPAAGGLGQGAGGSKEGVVVQEWDVLRCLTPAGKSRAWAGWEGSSLDQPNRDQPVWVPQLGSRS